MQAVILLAGYGSRLDRDDLPHKCLLPFNGETLLSRHLSCLEALNIERVHLVVGHNKEAIKEYVRDLNPRLNCNFVDNDVYRTTGNTLSMVMGLRLCEGDALILDGDVLYPRSVFIEYVQKSAPTSFALIPSDIDNAESSKMLLKASGAIEAFITKRDLTQEERTRFRFGGEAIGFFKLSSANVKKFIALYESNEADFAPVLWEIPFTTFAEDVELLPWSIEEPGCFEIDTQEDYEEALASFLKNPEKY
ncbi:MAG: NTP transferase domain-containing protein [Nitrospinae bacterium]|nr:NTP transferase domain-containing protein [Nitrospinota bacterium]